MKETYYIFKEEDLNRISGPVQNEWDKHAIFKQDLLDICKKVTVDDENSNDTDSFDACSIDIEENNKLKESVGDVKAPVPSYNVIPPEIFSTCSYDIFR